MKEQLLILLTRFRRLLRLRINSQLVSVMSSVFYMPIAPRPSLSLDYTTYPEKPLIDSLV